MHGTLTGVDLAGRTVGVLLADGSTRQEPYDVLVISTGVTNGFWRRPDLQSTDEVNASLQAAHERLADAASINVVGGGAAAVSTAANLATTWPDKQVDLYFPGERPLPRHHPRVWQSVESRLADRGVVLHPGHRAVVPDGFACDRITDGPVEWSTGQPPAPADATVWAIGRVRPNTEWVPPELLDEDGFVRVAPDLSVPGRPGVFAIGDVAATDPLRSSARNRADKLLAKNIRAYLGRQAARGFQGAARPLGLGARRPGRRPGGLRPQRQGVPLPGVVDPDGAAALDRATRDLRRGQAGRLTSRRSCGPRLRRWVSASQPLGRESRTTLCHALATCLTSGRAL